MPWSRPQPIDLDLTPFLRPGQRNQITLRVLNNIDVFGASGIYERMFLYAKSRRRENPDRCLRTRKQGSKKGSTSLTVLHAAEIVASALITAPV